MKIILKETISKLSCTPGVYMFKDSAGNFLYIGKATSLKSRVGSYFSGRIEDRPIFTVIDQIEKIETIKTDSVLEALILEANLIRKYQPKYNVALKDDRSFSYAVITKEKFPRVIILRRTELEEQSKIVRYSFGPYTSRRQLELALKILRKIFPYHVREEQSEENCFDYQIGLCPGPYAGAISRGEYLKHIRDIRMILEGKKKGLLRKLQKEMETYSKNHEFEQAAETRNQIFALKHIHDIALISRENFPEPAFCQKGHEIEAEPFRIEAYDISNISGQYAVGSMVVFQSSEPEKSQYRKFKIKTISGADDVGMMREVLMRRFHNDWPKPDLILLDGGQGHLNMYESVAKSVKLLIPAAAVAKGPRRKNLDVRYDVNTKLYADSAAMRILNNQSLLKRIMDEAHRFAITYHKKVRKREFINRA